MEVSAEVHFAQKLAANEKKIRDRAIKRLHKYLSVRSTHGGLSDEDLLKIWKGLFYCMWMQDKPLIQEELSKRITNLIHCFPSTVDSLRFVKVFFETNAREWIGIDKLRLDKFLMMVRDMLHETFSLLSKDDWPLDQCITLTKILAKHVMQPDEFRLPDGLKLHLSDIFVEEIVKVSLEKMTSKKLMVLLEPFLYFILNSNKIELVKRIMLDVVYRSVNRFNGELPRPALWEQKMYKRKKKEKKQKAAEGEKTAAEEVVPQQEVEEKVKEAEEMEVEETHSSFVLDKRLLLLLLFKQAERKNIKAPNRAVVYKFMKKYPEELGLINNLLNNNQQSEDSKDESLSNYTSDLNELDALLLEFAGKVVDQQKAKKRKKKKKKNIKECEIGDGGKIVDGPLSSFVGKPEAMQSSDSDVKVHANGLTGQSEAKPKKKKESSVGLKQSKLTISSHDSVKCDTETQSAVKSDNSSPPKKKSKKVCETLLDNSHSVSEPAVEESPTAVEHKKSRKRKRRSSELSEDVSFAGKKQKLSLTGDASQSSVASQEAAETLEMQPASDSQLSVDTNSNARSSSLGQSPKKQHASSMELVTYAPSRTGKPPTTTILLDKIHGSPPRRVSSVSPSKDPAKPAVGSSSPPKPKKTISKKLEPGSSPTKEATKSLLHTPAASPSKKKCVASSADNCSDPGPSRQFKDVKPFSTPVASFTPAAKKKVVFNLRKNKANKFKDYLMSLANQPDPPYEPTKSPSCGILKSPNVQRDTPLSEDSDLDISRLSMSKVIKSAMKHESEGNKN